jgi:hypothetical protein
MQFLFLYLQILLSKKEKKINLKKINKNKKLIKKKKK